MGEPSDARCDVRFSICIPSIRDATVGDTIDSVVAQTRADWELVVIGQGSRSADVEAVVRAHAPPGAAIRFVHLDRPGLSRARNAAIRATTGEIIAYLDDDCVVAPDWLEALDRQFALEPQASLVCGALLAPPRGRHLFASCPQSLPGEVFYRPDDPGCEPPPEFSIIGATLAIRRSLADQVGAFDVELGPGAAFPMCDDSDYFNRAEMLGAPMRSSPTIVVHHRHGWRYGWRAVWNLKRNSAEGWAAVSAKFTMLGDARGPAMYHDGVVGPPLENLRRLHLHRLPTNVLRALFFHRAYRRCLADYELGGGESGPDPVRSFLVPKQARTANVI